MKVALLQLSDIHIQSDEDFIIKHQEPFYRSCKALINECTKLIVIISGDIAFKGSKEEYDLAYNWLKKCEESWRDEATFLNSVEYIAVPGNHDCDFSRQDEVREIVISKLSQQDNVGSGNAISTCLSVQENFWSFYNRLRGDKLNADISWVHEVPLKQDFSIIFNCYNSAFLSQLKEQPGGLIIPQDKFIYKERTHPQDVIISLYHHNTGWLNPNTPLNNKKSFENHLFCTSNVVMCGHEHSNQDRKISSLSDSRELIYFESSALQYEMISKYSLMVLDTDEMTLTRHQLEYSEPEEIYKFTEDSTQFSILKKLSGILFNNEWVDKLSDIRIPLTHTKKTTLKLPDIFVFPDLDPLSDIKRSRVQYMDSEGLLENTTIAERIIFLEGENQAGKTSLLRMLCLSLHQKGIYPIMVFGGEIKHHNISQQLKNSYKDQYQHKKYNYERYTQLDRNKKVLLIDDFDKSPVSNESKSKLLTQLLCNFEKIIVTTNIQMDVRSILLDLINPDNLKRFKILALGCCKRNALIEKWVRLGEDVITLNEQCFLNRVKDAYDNISTLLGQQLIPSYPIFILSLLQGLNQVLDKFDTSQTSYAFCYNSLIIASLINSKMEKENIPGVLRFLSEFAYYHYSEHTERRHFNKDEFQSFYINYNKNYYTRYSTESLLQNLCKADIIRSEDNSKYSFSYKYIFYYLVAQKISQLINDNNAEGLVQRLCENLHKEREANILIFLVFHNGTGKQLEDVLFASMLPFEDQKPISLNINDPLFKGISDIVDNIKSDVMLQNINPKENREATLKNSDEIQRRLDAEEQQSYLTEKDFEENTHLRDINNTFKIIQIIGQISKNQRHTLTKEDLLRLIEESYNVCFRSISFFGTLIEEAKEEITEHFVNNYKDKCQVKETELRTRVHKLLHMLLFQQCLASFSNLSRAVGMSNSHDLFEQVAARIGTPAAKIISFTINTYYNKMNIVDLEELVKEHRKNPVVMEIIKARVVNYIYNNYVDFKQCQRIGDICQLKLVNSARILTSPHWSVKSK